MQRGHASLPQWTALLSILDEPLPENAKNQWDWNYAQQEVKSLLEKLEIRLELQRTLKEHP